VVALLSLAIGAVLCEPGLSISNFPAKQGSKKQELRCGGRRQGEFLLPDSLFISVALQAQSQNSLRNAREFPGVNGTLNGNAWLLGSAAVLST